VRLTGWLLALVLGVTLTYSVVAGNSRVAHLVQQADSLAVSIRDLKTVADSQRTADSIKQDALQAYNRMLRANRLDAIAQTDSAVDSLARFPLGNDRTQFGTPSPFDSQMGMLRASLTAERHAATRIIVSQDSMIQWLASRMRYWRDTVMVAKDAQLAIAQRLLREALSARTPRLSCGVSATAGYGLRGPDVVGGYGCTVRVRLPF